MLYDERYPGGPVLNISDIRELFPLEFRQALRMDLNRPFGNGVDDDGDGLIDESNELSGNQTERYRPIRPTLPPPVRTTRQACRLEQPHRPRGISRWMFGVSTSTSNVAQNVRSKSVLLSAIVDRTDLPFRW